MTSGGIEHLEAQAARLRHLAGELQHDLDTTRETLTAATVQEVTGRIDRHLAEAMGLEAAALRARAPDEHLVPGHFALAGDDHGHRVGG
jgi:hypothetical protein